MSDYTPTTEQNLAGEIARVRHGQDVTASDLANRLMPWLAAHDAEVGAMAWDAGAESVVSRIEDGVGLGSLTNPYRTN